MSKTFELTLTSCIYKLVVQFKGDYRNWKHAEILLQGTTNDVYVIIHSQVY